MRLKHRWHHVATSVHESESGVRIHTLGYAHIGGKTYCVNSGDGEEQFHKFYRILSRKKRNPRLRALMLWAEYMEAKR